MGNVINNNENVMNNGNIEENVEMSENNNENISNVKEIENIENTENKIDVDFNDYNEVYMNIPNTENIVYNNENLNMVNNENNLNELNNLNDLNNLNYINNLSELNNLNNLSNLNWLQKSILKIKEKLEIIISTVGDICIEKESFKGLKLPFPRTIPEKCELIKKYNEYFLNQNFPKFICKNEFNKTESKQHINEFEKLLNWKKYRILFGKIDYLVLRTTIFDLDMSLKLTPEDNIIKNNYPIEYWNNTITNKKKIYYVNNEYFDQFCNRFNNEALILNKFANLSYLITTSADFNNNLLSSCKVEYEYQKNNKLLNEKSKKQTAKLSFSEKKVNSKLNTFIYKPKYEKQKIMMPSATQANLQGIIYII